jgi:nitroimidazol reductase NimA-like FMN-containing flavoprotein (pyridoxamine 5'-phosphate oxidase superfamily)
MTRHDEADAIARAIIGSSLYMVLGTGDEAGTPWVSPVWYAHDGPTTFYWVSSPDAKHSRNLAGRPEISIVIFDSGAPISAGQAVYMSAVAGELGEVEAGAAIEVFSRRKPGARSACLDPRRRSSTGRAPSVPGDGVGAVDPRARRSVRPQDRGAPRG